MLTQPGARPIIIAGHGVELARAESQLLQFAERHNLPVVNTILGMGTFPQNHPQWYGMIGMHGEAATNYAVDQANVVIGIGSRFDDRITGSLPEFIANKTFVHFEVDGSEIGKIVPTAVPLVGDLDHTLKRANTLLTAHQFASWWETLTELKRQYSFLQLPKYNGTQLSQPHVVNMISNITVGKAIVASDVGRHQMWVSRFYRFAQSHSHLSAGGLGSMGYGIPAAMGAALGNPGREVWAIVGDGGFMMNVQELATLAEHNIPVKIVVMADGVLGMVHQWQALLFNQNYSSIHLHNPDFYKLAEAFNIPAWSVTKMSELEKVINNARTVVGPTLIVCKVDPHQNIFPMVPPNTALRDQALNAEKIYVK
ncbi:MAG: acetolactate synthase, large subunit, biosynthetic type [uncultured bacterium]|nr:MAG: acetolactate synthase, large subunit, biosynthetic type [uncultured bacterium]